MLTSTPVLSSPDLEKTFILQTDDSNYCVGAVMSQTDGEGLDHPVAYFSNKLPHREQKYSTIEKECLAIKLAVKAFQMYLLGWPFRLLQWLSNVKDENSVSKMESSPATSPIWDWTQKRKSKCKCRFSLPEHLLKGSPVHRRRGRKCNRTIWKYKKLQLTLNWFRPLTINLFVTMYIRLLM